MPARRNIVPNLLRFIAILAGTAFAALWRLLKPAADQKLEVSQNTIEKLSELQSRTKYVEIPGTIYIGMRPESSRLLAERQLNQLVDRLQDGLPSKKFVLTEFAKTMAEFEATDTEDREQLLRYLEEIMEILGISSSDGLLSRWMYGSVLGSLLSHLKEASDKTNQQRRAD